jgi:protein-tyrosine-phosphatase
MRILFICSGNICRSPMAAEYARHKAVQSGLDHLVVDSAGTLGIEGAPASEEAVKTLETFGLDITSHRSRGLRKGDMKGADRVLVMEHRHLDELERRFPGWDRRVYLLRAFEESPDPIHGAPDLEDPIGHPMSYYRERFEEIRKAVDNLMLHLRNVR